MKPPPSPRGEGFLYSIIVSKGSLPREGWGGAYSFLINNAGFICDIL